MRRSVTTQRLGDILRSDRLEAGLSEREMALAIQRSATFVRAYESGKASLTIDDLESAARVLGSTLSEFVAEYEGT